MEHWERWIPINGLPSKLHNDTFVDNKEGIILEFSDEKDKKKIVVKFEEGVLSYRNTDEGSLLKKLNYLDQQYGTDFYSNWTLFKVKNSEYIKWFLEESSGIYEPNQLEHYVFLTPNDVIEILATYTPSIVVK
ncbi:hypothetical protein AT864_00838 [Anoxybacillus sp. P3H1B]|uniref:Uncharacterized protein n=1 Tax=Anoxybacteroides rupiense TaxID=311460 RepID=A0ABD5IY46_9BACL|nr:MULTISPECIES: hypothetical protein [Anoxybacillus]KXG10247.1 hypothetical protein AT864_00838 [Anoxybacillus sp. P3H1B]MED5053287.1 hypothetical protein [Anoxybacillus rupiensis]OQM47136.1 hypothetical protein B6A27_02275 [Anoxybacillus sp. UARK-01]